MSDVFVSYSRKDSEFVGGLTDALVEMGFRVWKDTSDVVGGDDWKQSVLEALGRAKVVVLVLSPDSMRSDHVEFEWREAQKLDKRIIPIMYRDTSVPKALERLNYRQIHHPPTADALAQLADDLKHAGVTTYKFHGDSVVDLGKAIAPSRIDWAKWGVIITGIGVVVAALVAIAQPFIADRLAQDDADTIVTTSPPPTRTVGPPTATFVPIPVDSVPLALAVGTENTLALIIRGEADVPQLALSTAVGTDEVIRSFPVVAELGGRVPSGTCLIYRRIGTSDPLPRECEAANTYEVEFAPLDVFWYDDASNRPLDVIVLRADETVAVCPTTSPRCDFSW